MATKAQQLEERRRHNEAAIKAAEAVRMNMYPGMILSVEAEEECTAGKGIVATSDDIFNVIPKALQYNPHVMARINKAGDHEDIGNRELKNPSAPKLKKRASFNLGGLL